MSWTVCFDGDFFSPTRGGDYTSDVLIVLPVIGRAIYEWADVEEQQWHHLDAQSFTIRVNKELPTGIYQLFSFREVCDSKHFEIVRWTFNILSIGGGWRRCQLVAERGCRPFQDWQMMDVFHFDPNRRDLIYSKKFGDLRGLCEILDTSGDYPEVKILVDPKQKSPTVDTSFSKVIKGRKPRVGERKFSPDFLKAVAKALKDLDNIGPRGIIDPILDAKAIEQSRKNRRAGEGDADHGLID